MTETLTVPAPQRATHVSQNPPLNQRIESNDLHLPNSRQQRQVLARRHHGAALVRRQDGWPVNSSAASTATCTYDPYATRWSASPKPSVPPAMMRPSTQPNDHSTATEVPRNSGHPRVTRSGAWAGFSAARPRLTRRLPVSGPPLRPSPSRRTDGYRCRKAKPLARSPSLPAGRPGDSGAVYGGACLRLPRDVPAQRCPQREFTSSDPMSGQLSGSGCRHSGVWPEFRSS
jgi:hypothetical protein